MTAREAKAEERSTTSYLHQAYARSFSEFGEPRYLPTSGGWLLERSILGTADRDAMGCYPLFTCRDWTGLASDLEQLEGALVTVAVVADPFGDYDKSLLDECFPAIVSPFKQHFIVELGPDPRSFVSAHHRRYAKRALSRLTVSICSDPSAWLDHWTTLYDQVIRRHRLAGVHAFSRTVFSYQLRVPGLVMLRAEEDGEVVAMTLWYIAGSIAYYHLGSASPRGYESRALFALFSYALEHFASLGIQTLDLGAGAGRGHSSEDDGLSRFKRGWSTGTVPAYFCGRILDAQRYRELAETADPGTSEYFPAYRQGELL
jgi:hypothetical protein